MSIFCRKEKNMAISIPPTEFVKLAKIVAYDEDFFGSLIKALSETKPSLTRGKYLADLISRLPGATEQDFSPILDTLYALYYAKNQSDVSTSVLAKQIRDIAAGSNEHGAIFSGEMERFGKKINSTSFL